MSAYPLTIVWLRILGLIALEVGLVALLFVVARRGTGKARWQRTLCQAALITVLVITFSELSGGGRTLVTLIFRSEGKPANIAARDGLLAPALSSGAVEGDTRQAQFSGDPKFQSEVTDRAVRHQVSDSDAATAFLTPLVADLKTEPAQEPPQAFRVVGSPMADHQSLITDSTALRALMLIWSIGVAFVLGRACFGRMVLLLFGARRQIVSDSELLQRVDSLARGLKLGRRVRVIQCLRLASPIAFGFIRPTIGLPLNFGVRFSAAKQDAVLTHELAHLAAHDPLWYLLADLAAAVLWWHPAIWWLRRQLHLLSELTADEASLIMVNGPRVLAECLVEMGAQLTKPALGQLRVAGFRSALGSRVERLMRLEGTGWRPVSRGWGLLARSFGPIAVAVTVILCTAWAVPQELTKGDSMKTMKQNWYRALAAFAAMAAIDAPAVSTAEENPTSAPASAAPVAEAPGALPYGRNPAEVRAELARNRAGAAGTPTPVGANPFYAGQPGASPRSGRLEGKLREIVLDEVSFESLPLSEVLKFMNDESRKRDPEKKGINFLLDPNPPQNPAPGAATVDPATGLPIAPTVMEPIDISSVSVRFNIPLRHVTMADVLDAIVRVADKPIQYTVEEYAVIFSLRPEAAALPSMAGRPSGPAPLAVRTFHVDTNTFVGGLESAFGIKVESKGKGESQSRKIQAALRELLSQLNISMEGNKSIFYNELTGTVMVRLAPEDLDVAQAAIETLGGQLITMYGNGMATLFVPRK